MDLAAIIEVEGLCFRYHDGTPALQDVSFSVAPGEKVALLGPNGAGKSTLLLHLNGIYHPCAGRVLVAGREVNRDSERWVRERVGLVFQDPDDQLFAPTVWDDVAFGPLNQGLPRGEVERRVEEALVAVGMWPYRHKAPHHLSYGQKKRVAIAGVLALDPEVVVLDEPTAFLDPAGQRALLEVLAQLHAAGKTLIIATHDVDLAAEWASSVIILKEGRVLAAGDRSLLADPDLVAAAELRLPLVTQVFRSVPGVELPRLPCTVEEGARALASLLTSRFS